MPRPNPRDRIDVLAREAQRAIEEQRQAVIPTDADLDVAARVSRSDVDAAISLWQEANAGTDVERLLDSSVASEGEG